MHPLLAAARAWVSERYSNAEHLLKAEEWLLRIHPQATLAQRLATVTHDMERAFPGPDSPYQDPARGPDDPVYNQAHSERSARIVGDFLRERQAPEALINEVARLIRAHEFGGWPEADQVQAADSLSFLEVNIGLFLSWLDKEQSPWSPAWIGAKFAWMYERIRIPEARVLARPLYEEACRQLRAKEE